MKSLHLKKILSLSDGLLGFVNCCNSLNRYGLVSRDELNSQIRFTETLNVFRLLKVL